MAYRTDIGSLAPELAMYLQCTLSVHHPSPPVSAITHNDEVTVGGDDNYEATVVINHDRDTLGVRAYGN